MNESMLRGAIRDIVGNDALQSFRKIDARHTLKDLAIIYLFLAATILSTSYLHHLIDAYTLLFTPLLALTTGVAFNWINVQIHEASHYLLFENKALNDAYCHIALGALALQDVNTYRATHAMHHTRLHTAQDPDLDIYLLKGDSKRELLSQVLEDLSLKTAFRRKRHVSKFINENKLPFPGVPTYTLFAKAAAQALVILCFWKCCGIWGFVYYPAFYLYGLLAVFPVLVRVRTVVQHYDESLPKAMGAALLERRSGCGRQWRQSVPG